MPGPVITHLVPASLVPDELPGSIAVVIDQLRASTTICAALHHGASRIVPCLEPEHAQAIKDAAPPHSTLTGGERHGLLIPGFDLDNSPRAYTPARVAAKTIAFTTTNGTRAVNACQPADEILIGCLANISALCGHLATDRYADRPIRLVCAGTRDRLTLDDALAAGAIADRLVTLGRPPNLPDTKLDDDSTLLALALWRSTGPAGALAALRASRGGRNLVRVGLDEDIRVCSALDTLPVVPTFDRALGAFIAAPR